MLSIETNGPATPEDVAAIDRIVREDRAMGSDKIRATCAGDFVCATAGGVLDRSILIFPAGFSDDETLARHLESVRDIQTQLIEDRIHDVRVLVKRGGVVSQVQRFNIVA